MIEREKGSCRNLILVMPDEASHFASEDCPAAGNFLILSAVAAPQRQCSLRDRADSGFVVVWRLGASEQHQSRPGNGE